MPKTVDFRLSDFEARVIVIALQTSDKLNKREVEKADLLIVRLKAEVLNEG